MPPAKKSPTSAQFQAFEAAYNYFNQVLFHYELPPVILNLSRKSKSMGFAAPNRWVQANRTKNTDLTKPETISTSSGAEMHELSINPEILYMSPIEVYSTLVHEQCHIWQFHCGKPSLRTYHNKQWGNKMLEVGLTPSTTGKPGGKMTGQSMSDYPTPGGVFLKALKDMPEHYKLPFISKEGIVKAQTAAGGTTPEPKPKNKVKYSCPNCEANIWGKPELNVNCGDCDVRFECVG